jgi:hypothetical protein
MSTQRNKIWHFAGHLHRFLFASRKAAAQKWRVMFFAQTPEWTAFGQALMGDLGAQFAGQGLDTQKMALVVTAPASFGAVGFAHRGAAQYFPAGLVAPFHMVHGLWALQSGRAAYADIDRALRDMMLWPSDSAANYVTDWLTGTTGDTPLEGAEYLDWAAKRGRLDRFYWQLDWPEWEGCRISQKQSSDLRFGRDAVYGGIFGAGLNALNAHCAARFLWELFEGDVPLGSDALRRAHSLMARDAASPEAVFPNFQLSTFLGGGLPSGVKLWSKTAANGWTGEARTAWVRHDMARICARGMRALHIVLMTQGRAMFEAGEELFPAIGRAIWDRAAPLLHLPQPFASQPVAPPPVAPASPAQLPPDGGDTYPTDDTASKG